MMKETFLKNIATVHKFFVKPPPPLTQRPAENPKN